MILKLQRWGRPPGYTSVELLTVLALSAIVIGGMVVSFGTLVRSQPQVASVVTVPLANARLTNFYGSTNSRFKDTPVAPSYGSLSRAELMREQFYHDVLSATAVFCLPRNGDNTWKPAYISYDPAVDDELDTPQKFRKHIIRVAGVAENLYLDFRNPGVTSGTLPTNASIFILSFSAEAKKMRVQAIYDIDMVLYPNGDTEPLGFHASVKRFTDPNPLPDNTSYTLVPSGSYSVFFPPSNPLAKKRADFPNDGFTPLFVTFERHTRLAQRESTAIDRFKLAAERPFYFIWWPDPAARHLGPQPNTAATSLPQQAYNHMAGRTSFMFTVPMFPTL